MNVWINTGIENCGVPTEVVGDAAMMRQLKGNGLSLYMYIMSLAWKRSAVVIELASKEIQDALGIPVNAVTSTATKLNDLGLVRLTRTKGPRGSFSFEILDPKTRLPLPDPRKSGKALKADSLTREQLTDYFMQRLGENFRRFDENGIMAVCPLCHRVNGRDSGTLSIRLPKATVGSCAVHCYNERCSWNSGASLIDFEMAAGDKKGNPSQAWQRITFIMLSKQRERETVDNALRAIESEMAVMA